MVCWMSFRVFDLVGLGWGWRVCMVNKFLDGVDVVDLELYVYSYGQRVYIEFIGCLNFLCRCQNFFRVFYEYFDKFWKKEI